MIKENSLQYILLAGLPAEEREKLKDNLRNDTSIKLVELYPAGDMWKTLEERELPVEECLLISGLENALEWGRNMKLPTIGYQLAKQQDMTAGSTYLQADMIVEGFEEVDAEFLLRIWQRYYGRPWTILTTERCVVRELELADLDALFALYENPKLTEYIEGLYPYEEELAYQKAYIECMYRFFGYGMWLVFEKTTGKLIGRAGIEHREELDGALELGYAIHPDYQRKGYGTEVCKAIIQYAFAELDFEEICCLIEKENEASIHFAKHLGFLFQKAMVLNEKEMFQYVKKR